MDNKINKVSVRAHGRLHMGFLDMHGGLGRKFGSLGLSLQAPVTHLEACLSDELIITGQAPADELTRIQRVTNDFLHSLNIKKSLSIQVHSLIPSHAGLGSGTQIKLALLAVINELNGLQLGDNRLLEITGRGLRSGIGLATFLHGGVVVDGGRRLSSTTGVPPMIAQADFPEAWRILLVMDPARQGVHGQSEIEAFKQLPPFSERTAEKLCRHVLMQALPALHEGDLPAFGEAVRALQLATGEHFAQAQGGLYASPEVSKVMQWFDAHDVACFGQSSWGPTGFAIFESENDAVESLRHIKAEFQQTKLGFTITSGCNVGAELTIKTNR